MGLLVTRVRLNGNVVEISTFFYLHVYNIYVTSNFDSPTLLNLVT